MTPHAAIKHAVGILGGQNAAARILGTRQQTINNWIHRTRRGVAAEFAVKIEIATDGAVTRYQLRPDVFINPEPDEAAA